MIYSMTGYGRSEAQLSDEIMLIEVKSVNGKNAEVNLRVPMALKSLEVDFRNKIIAELKRGSIDMYASVKEGGKTKNISINSDVLSSYYNSIHEFAQSKNINQDSIMASLLSLPEVTTVVNKEWSDEEVKRMDAALNTALGMVTQYREEEGAKLEKHFLAYIQEIRDAIPKITALSDQRVDKIKSRLQKSVEEFSSLVDFDKNRMEQEIFYYTEKLDVSEEIQRLNSHLSYFDEIVQNSDIVKGKKLNFISQEIGRELNTLGSKSYHSAMQKIVIQMKDSLEKIKEQINNVL